MKSGLLDKGLPLLAKDYIEALIEGSEKLGGKIATATGLSADEMRTYHLLLEQKGNHSPLVGLNKGFAPALLRNIQNQSADSQAITHILKTNISQGIPLVDNSCSLGMLYVWHHIPPDQKAAVLAEILRVSGKMADGGIALNIFEPLSSKKLLKMVLDTNRFLGHETAMFDAMIGTTILGGQTEESLAEELSQLQPKVKWYTETLPAMPTVVSGIVLPQQQVRIAAYVI